MQPAASTPPLGPGAFRRLCLCSLSAAAAMLVSAVACPVPGCSRPASTSGYLARHLRDRRSPSHIAFRRNLASNPALRSSLSSCGLAACPRPGCNFFSTAAVVSRHTRSCSAGSASASGGCAPANHFMPASAAAVYSQLESDQPVSPNSAALRWCLQRPGHVSDFLRDHQVRTTPAVCRSLPPDLLSVETELWEMAAATRGDQAAAAAFDALLIFPACTKYPHQSGASSSQVARECSCRLRLWVAGDLDSLLREAVAASAPRGRSRRSAASWLHGRAAELVRVQCYKAAAALTESYGAAPCTEETVTSLRDLFPSPSDVPAPGLATPDPTAPAPRISGPTVTVESLRYVLSKSPRRSAPHRDGWRSEHLRAAAADDRCARAMAGVFTRISGADVPPSTKLFLGSATLVALMKKDDSEVRAMRDEQGGDFRLPVRPIAFGTVLVRVAALCALYAVRADIPASVGPHQCQELPENHQGSLAAT